MVELTNEHEDAPADEIEVEPEVDAEDRRYWKKARHFPPAKEVNEKGTKAEVAEPEEEEEEMAGEASKMGEDMDHEQLDPDGEPDEPN